MNLPSWKKLVRRHAESRGRRVRTRSPEKLFRPQLQQLEERCLLSVVRTLVYNEITTFPVDGSTFGVQSFPSPVLSGNGNRAVFSTRNADNIPRVQVINADGTGQPHEVDAYSDFLAAADISDDGSKVVSYGSIAGVRQIRIANADGVGRELLRSGGGGSITEVHFTGDGTKVLFAHRSNNTITIGGTSTDADRGIWAVDVDAIGLSGLRQVVGPAKMFNELGLTVDDNFWTPTGFSDIGVSDGEHLVFSTFVKLVTGGEQQELFGVNLDGSGLHQLDYGPVGRLYNVGISGDGTEAFYYVNLDPCCSSPDELGVIKFDGTGRRVLTSNPPGFPTTSDGFPGSQDRIQLTGDGSHLLAGSTGVLIDMATGAPLHPPGGQLQLSALGGSFSSDPPALATSGMFHATMNSSGTRFLYINSNGVNQLATLDLNPSSLGAAPSITNPVLDPPYILVQGGSNATFSTQVTAAPGSTLVRVGNAVLLNGLDDRGVTHAVLCDTGLNGSPECPATGDNTAGDGEFTNNAINADSSVLPEEGRRVVRFKAESRSGDGRRHATAIDVKPFDVVVSPPPQTVEFSEATYTVGEAAGSVNITVDRRGGTAGTCEVNFASSDGTARASSDYGDSSRHLVFADRQASQTFTIPIVNDGLVEPSETVNLTLSNATGTCSVGTPSTSDLTITDNDGTGAVRVTPTSGLVTTEAGGTATFTVVLGSIPTADVTIALSSSNTNEGTVSPTSLTFTPANALSPQTVTVTGVDDSISDGDIAYTIVTGTASSSDSNYNGFNPDDVSVTNTDNEAAQPGQLQFDVSTYSVNESDGSVTITVTRTGGSSVPVSVAFATSNGTATAGSDYTATSGTLNFGVGETSKTFSIPVLDDTSVEGNETVNLTLSSPTGGASLGTPSTAVLTVIEDDFCGQSNLALTPAGIAAGFSLSNFASGFPTSLGIIGPMGIAFTDSGGVMVSDSPGNVRVFPTDSDGQNAGSVPAGGFYGFSNAVGLARVASNFYATQQSLGKVVQINADGSSNQDIVNVSAAVGIVTNPNNGHLLVSSQGLNAIVDVDPIFKTSSTLVSGLGGQIPDGLAISPNGDTVYVANNGTGHVLGFNTTSGVQVFDSGVIGAGAVEGIDGIVLGPGALARKLYVNTNAGRVIEVNLDTLGQTVIASGGTRGDFLVKDPFNGTILVT